MKRLGRRDQHGFFTIWILGLCLIMFAFGGLSLDLWKGFTERRELAAIADSAAIAGAAQISIQAFQSATTPPADGGTVALDPDMAKAHALAYLNQAATEDNFAYSNVDVEVVNNEVDVMVQRKVDLTLTKLLLPNHEYVITVHSAAQPRVAA